MLFRSHSPRSGRPEIHFVDYNAMRQVLTARRMELLGLIKDRTPGSVYELSQMAGRDLKNVQDDVALLERLGFIHVTRQRTHRHRAVPRVNYDAFDMKVPVSRLAHVQAA